MKLLSTLVYNSQDIGFLLFTQTAPKIERNKTEYWQSSKINQYFLKTILFIRYNRQTSHNRH